MLAASNKQFQLPTESSQVMHKVSRFHFTRFSKEDNLCCMKIQSLFAFLVDFSSKKYSSLSKALIYTIEKLFMALKDPSLLLSKFIGFFFQIYTEKVP